MELGLPGSTCRRKRSTARAGRAMVAAGVERHGGRDAWCPCQLGPALGGKKEKKPRNALGRVVRVS